MVIELGRKGLIGMEPVIEGHVSLMTKIVWVVGNIDRNLPFVQLEPLVEVQQGFQVGVSADQI